MIGCGKTGPDRAWVEAAGPGGRSGAHARVCTAARTRACACAPLPVDTTHSPDAYLCIPRNTAVNLGIYAHPNGTTWANDVGTIKIWGDPDNGRCSGTDQVRQGTVPDGWRP
ncbi:hypothetical protein GCM10010451_24860 [Streptomyces virens]|uniref:Uncharacterized protein n=1 Tax=Streptomyces virens TaxID=285572 RepID=A0ABP6PEL4_9ACTN